MGSERLRHEPNHIVSSLGRQKLLQPPEDLACLLHTRERQARLQVEDIHGFYFGHGIGCKDSRLIPLVANDMPAFGHYKLDPDGVRRPWAIQVLEITDGRVSHLHHFIGPKLFERFGLPPELS